MNAPLPAAEVEAVEGPTDAQIAAVRRFAERAVSLEGEIALLSESLTKLNEERSVILDRELVNAMAEARLEVWPMPGGLSFELATLVNGSIPKDRQEEAFSWLEANGHGDLIKRKFTIQFGREDIAWAKKFRADLAKRKKPLNVEERMWVEPMTQGAFVREQLKLAAAEGRDPEELAPTALLGVFKRTFARLVAPKAAKARPTAARAK